MLDQDPTFDAYFCSLIQDPILLSVQTEMIITFCNPLFPLFKDINVGVLTNENSLIVKMTEEPDRKQSKKLIFETFKK